jgi:formate hydrogenlyase subunit 6/NADH:ubiquinone oxidoreductase subunit I
MHVVPSEEGDRELGEFILRSGRCLFCGFCAQVCPVDAITMSSAFERSVLDRDGLIYTKTELAAFGAQNETWWGADSPPNFRHN